MWRLPDTFADTPMGIKWTGLSLVWEFAVSLRTIGAPDFLVWLQRVLSANSLPSSSRMATSLSARFFRWQFRFIVILPGLALGGVAESQCCSMMHLVLTRLS